MYEKLYSPQYFSKVVKSTGECLGDKPFPPLAKFLVGGVSGTTAAFIVHPLDFLKTRMQMTGKGSTVKLYTSTLDKILQIYRVEGLLGFYNGGSACLLKQSVYTTVRLGLYTNLLEVLSEDERKPSFTTKLLAGSFAGMCSGFMATPLDVCLVRMMYDGSKPEEKQFKYKHPFDALSRVFREEGGIKGLYRGGTTTTLRSGIVGIGLGTYSQIKQCCTNYLELQEGVRLHFCSSMLSGLITAIITMPFDLLKTRTQSMTTNKRLLRMVGDIVRKEGPLAFWKGFTPYYMRIAPITVLTFVLVEQLSYLYSVYVLCNKKPKSNLYMLFYCNIVETS